jgi:hypothetical protein
MHKINYNIKNTSANTLYLDIDKKDMDILQITILGLLTYMTELSIAKDKEIRQFIKWFITSDSRYLYNKKLSRNNSPQSFLAGIVNNLQFGLQRDFSLVQLQTTQNILNSCIDIIDAISVSKAINLQTNYTFTKIWAQENNWVFE